MGAFFIPVSAKLLCAAQGPRATIHAVGTPTVLCAARDRAPVVRTICGLDAVPHMHQAIDQTGAHVGDVITVWPAPAADRCPDCAAITGVGRRKAAGSSSFTDARPVTPARTSAA